MYVHILYLSAGPDHMTMYIVPQPGIELVDWSIDRGHPTAVSKRKDSNETLYFVYYSHGIKPDKPWQFYLDFKVQANQKVLNACIYTCTCTCSVCLHVPVLYFIKIQSSNTHKTCVCMPVLCYTQMAKFYPFKNIRIYSTCISYYFLQMTEKTDMVTEIALCGHYLHGDQHITPLLQRFMDSLPDWTVPNPWVVTYNLYQF